MAAMSTSLSSGFVGDSIQTAFVRSVTTASSAAGSHRSTNENASPCFVSTLLNSR
jgi:hypothetical protein